ncbi:uncharacterized protein LOC111829627 [Capsella rubella]|uniref:uncharacterized protein LOC111829627 n=1 Tax=Capsella rubella TaxID=81985 RepID=UPI000CD4D962|nr:uncharacterized protein LOC111829627 [Capsella rubella]
MDLPNFAMARLGDSQLRIVIHWDFENVCIPRGFRAAQLFRIVENRLRQLGYEGEIEFRAFWGTKGPSLEKHRRELEGLGVKFYQAPEAVQDAADHLMLELIDKYGPKLLKDLLTQYGEVDAVVQEYVHIFIAGDHIYANVAQLMLGMGTTVLLIYPRLACANELREVFPLSARMTWLSFLGRQERR